MIPPRRILCARDFSEPAGDALTCAIHLAARSGATLDVLYADVLHENPFDPSEHPATAAEVLRTRLCEEMEHGSAPPYDPGSIRLHHAAAWGESADDAIVRYVADHEVDLVVMGTHRRSGLGRLILGSVAEAVAQRAACPVLTVHAGERLGGGPVVVGVSFTDGCDEAIGVGKSMAHLLGVPVRLVHVVTSSRIEGSFSLEPLLRRRLLERAARIGPAVPLHAAILYGAPGEELSAYAAEVSAAMVTVGLARGDRPILGNTMERVLHTSHCPVLIAQARLRGLPLVPEPAAEAPAFGP